MTAPAGGGRPPGWYRSGATRRPAQPPAGPLADAAWTIVSQLITGIAVYAGIGWLLSLWLGHQAALVAGGALAGVALSLYLIVKRLSASQSGAGSQEAPAGRRREDVPRVR